MMKRLSLTLIALSFTAMVFAQPSTTTHTSTESSTISINSSDHDYSVIASFGKAKAAKIKEMVSQALGKPATDSEDLSFWNLKNTYTATLKPEKLIIDLDKDKATGTLTKTVESLCADLQRALGTSNAPFKPLKD
jgi:hypothetical protein